MDAIRVSGFSSSIAVFLLATAHVLPAAWSVYHALLYKRDSRAATGWIMFCIFVPFAGPIAYFLLGINRVRSRAQGLRKPFYVVEYESSLRSLRDQKPRIHASGSFAAGERISGVRAVAGNAVSALHHGDEAYPAMIAAISNARHSVRLATYIFKCDEVGFAFADALQAASNRGVDVKVLIDGVGELYSRRSMSRLLAARGVPVARFMPPRLFPPSFYVNLRNHRKLLVVDCDTAFVGGMNISQENTSTSTTDRSVSDIHFLLRGPAGAQLAQVFDADWKFVTNADSDRPSGESPAAAGSAECRVIPDGPDTDLDALALTIQAAVSSAVTSVDIVTPYFVPSRDLLATLVSALLRGVELRIVLPGKNNIPFVHWASRNSIMELLHWGAAVYYQPPPFSHSKLLCVDDDYSLIGSANLDARSLRLNFEIGVEVLDAYFSKEVRAHIESLIAASTPESFRALVNRSVPVRIRDSAAALLSPYL